MAKLIDNSVRFLKETRTEMMKVTWPGWDELKGSTILVIIVSAFFAIYIGGVDILFSFVRRLF